MDITAKLRVYVVRRSSHTSLERDFNHNTRARSFPGVFSSACSKTSTCAPRRRSGRVEKRGEKRYVRESRASESNASDAARAVRTFGRRGSRSEARSLPAKETKRGRAGDLPLSSPVGRSVP